MSSEEVEPAEERLNGEVTPVGLSEAVSTAEQRSPVGRSVAASEQQAGENPFQNRQNNLKRKKLCLARPADVGVLRHVHCVISECSLSAL